MQEDLKKQLKEFIAKRFLKGKSQVRDDESLFAAGIIDSFGMLELIAFIEKNFDVRVNPSEIDIDTFDTVDKIVSFVEKKKKRVA
ncbi:MAG: phosphopantetheine-binding protein [Candidatus Omnitrophota bacterium]